MPLSSDAVVLFVFFFFPERIVRFLTAHKTWNFLWRAVLEQYGRSKREKWSWAKGKGLTISSEKRQNGMLFLSVITCNTYRKASFPALLFENCHGARVPTSKLLAMARAVQEVAVQNIARQQKWKQY